MRAGDRTALLVVVFVLLIVVSIIIFYYCATDASPTDWREPNTAPPPISSAVSTQLDPSQVPEALSATPDTPLHGAVDSIAVKAQIEIKVDCSDVVWTPSELLVRLRDGQG